MGEEKTIIYWLKT